MLLLKLMGPLSWMLLGAMVAGIGLLLMRWRSPLSPIVSGLTLPALLGTLALGGVLFGALMFMLASNARYVWLVVGDSSPERITNVYVWDPVRHPWSFDSHPRGAMADSTRPGFDEVRIYGLDPNPPTVFVARRGDRWYAIDRENAP